MYSRQVDPVGYSSTYECRGGVGTGGVGTGGIGYVGPTGPQGVRGSTGPQGPIGNIGYLGVTGSVGPQGSIGNNGSTGVTGTTGSIGAMGPTGATGIIGFTGILGDTGNTGNVGSLGNTGFIGVQGNVGSNGPTGVPGQNSVASGTVFFFDSTSAGLTGSQNVTGSLLLTPNETTGTSVTYTLNNDNLPHLLGSFLTDSNILPTSTIIGGLWDINPYFSTNQSTLQMDAYFKIDVVQSDGTTLVYSLYDGSSNYLNITTSSNIAQIFTQSIYIDAYTIPDPSYRIRVQVWVIQPTGSTTGNSITMYFRDQTQSHLHTTLVNRQPTGSTGSQGAMGVTGILGTIGPQGVQGSQGLQGSQGATGATGVVGFDGATGLTGGTGNIGLLGLTGATGLQGIQGSQGATGPQGSQGITGPQGPTGNTGQQGVTGATGTTGATGLSNTGATGPIGASITSETVIVGTGSQLLSTSIDNSILSNTLFNISRSFITKIDTQGTTIASSQAQGSLNGIQDSEGNYIYYATICSNGRTFSSQYYNTSSLSTVVQSSPVQATTNVRPEIVKFNSQGELLWKSNTIYTLVSSIPGLYFSAATPSTFELLDVDQEDNIWYCATANGYRADWTNPNYSTYSLLPQATNVVSSYITKLNKNGYLINASKLTTTISNSGIGGASLHTMGTDAYLSVQTSDPLQIFNSNFIGTTAYQVIQKPTITARALFLIKYNTNVNYQWAMQIINWSNSIAASISQRIVDDGVSIYSAFEAQISGTPYILNSDGTTYPTGLTFANTAFFKASTSGFVSWTTRVTIGTVSSGSMRYFNDSLYATLRAGTTATIAYNSNSTVGATLPIPPTGSSYYLIRYDTSGICKQFYRICGVTGTSLISYTQVDGTKNCFYMSLAFRGSVVLLNSNNTIYTTLASYSPSFYSYAIAQYSINGMGQAVTICGGSNGNVQFVQPTPVRVSKQGNIIMGGGYVCNPLYIYNFGSNQPDTTNPVTVSNVVPDVSTLNSYNSILLAFSPSQGTQQLPDPSSNKIRYVTTSGDNINATTITTATPLQNFSTLSTNVTLQGTGSNLQLYWNGINWEVISNQSSTFY